MLGLLDSGDMDENFFQRYPVLLSVYTVASMEMCEDQSSCSIWKGHWQSRRSPAIWKELADLLYEETEKIFMLQRARK